MNFKKEQFQNDKPKNNNHGNMREPLFKYRNQRMIQTPSRKTKYKNNIELCQFESTSPPKHYCKDLISKQHQVPRQPLTYSFDHINFQDSKCYPLQRCSPQKSSKATESDKECLKLCGNDLSQFIKSKQKDKKVVFQSKVEDLVTQKLKQDLQNKSCNFQQSKDSTQKKQRDEKIKKPPTPQIRKLFESQSASPNKHKQQNSQCLQFSDNFQSSNLKCAIKYDQSTYFLTVRLDSNTNSYGQWFYFKVKNPTDYDQHCRIIILNMTKSQVLFGKGMKPAISRCGAWSKQGRDICYWKNSFIRKKYSNGHEHDYAQGDCNITKTNETAQLRKFKFIKDKESQNMPDGIHDTYYSLGFTIFLHARQQIQVACHQPYTYSRLYRILDYLTNQVNQSQQKLVLMKRKVLAKSFLDNRVELLTFSFNKQYNPIKQNLQLKHADSLTKAQVQGQNKKSKAQLQTRKFSSSIQQNRNSGFHKKIENNHNGVKNANDKGIVLILGRSHPVQTTSSFVIQGIIQELLNIKAKNHTQDSDSESPLKCLFEKYTFKVLPMINPDGVITGNSRVNCKGFDLNAEWKHTSNDRTAQIFTIKKVVDEIKSKIVMVLDIHGNSKTKGVIFEGFSQKINQNVNQPKEFAYIFSKTIQNDKVFLNSRWKNTKAIQKSQEGISTYALYKRLKIQNIFKISVSCCSEQKNYHYDERSLKNIGSKIIESISVYFAQKKQPKFALKQHFKQMVRASLSNLKGLDQTVEADCKSQSDSQHRVHQRSIQGSQQKKRTKSRQNSQSRLSVHKSKNYYRVSQLKSSKIQHKSSLNNQRSKSRKKTEPKNTQNNKNQLQLSSNRKSMKNLSHHNRRIVSKFSGEASSYRKNIQQDEQNIGNRSPIKIPKINKQIMHEAKKSKSQSYQTPNKNELTKDNIDSNARISKNLNKLAEQKNNLKQIMQASSQLKNSQIQGNQHSKCRSAAHNAAKCKNIINADFMGEKQSPVQLKNQKQVRVVKNQKNRVSQVFQRAGVQVANNILPYQILKTQIKAQNQHPRINDVIFKINNIGKTKLKSADK